MSNNERQTRAITFHASKSMMFASSRYMPEITPQYEYGYLFGNNGGFHHYSLGIGSAVPKLIFLQLKPGYTVSNSPYINSGFTFGVELNFGFVKSPLG